MEVCPYPACSIAANGLVESISERQLLRRSRPRNSSDGLVEQISERQLAQGSRSLKSSDACFNRITHSTFSAVCFLCSVVRP